MLDVALLIAVAALTPGPNNLIVMRAASRSGLRGALVPIVAIVFGGLALLATVVAGIGTRLAMVPSARVVIAVLGALYLAWIGLRMILGRLGEPPASGRAAGTMRAAGLFAFQFLNPKAWVMVLTVFAAVSAGADPARQWLLLGLLYMAIPAVCLGVWSALGAWIEGWMQRPAHRVRFDRAMGLLLVGSALSLVADIFLHDEAMP